MIKPSLEDIAHSGVGGVGQLSDIWALPNLPLTEQFGDFDSAFPTFNQGLTICEESGHFQLQKCVDPDFLYSAGTYNFRTLPSQKISNELNFLINSLEINKFLDDKARVLELGGNNCELANLLSSKVKSYAICDPMIIPNEDIKSNVFIWDDLIENCIGQVIEFRPTLILGRHVLEHIVNPFEILSKLVELVPDGTIFCFEVPSLNQILSKLRFDAFFHQHIHYFDEDSVAFLVQKLNCELIKILTNPVGSNGGSLLFSFKKSSRASNLVMAGNPDIATKLKYFEVQLNTFRNVIDIQKAILDNWTGMKFGFGAGLLLSTYNYHLGGRVELLDGILDDDPTKEGLSYKNINIDIFGSDKLADDTPALILITALENQLALRKRIGKARSWTGLGLPIF